MFGSRRFMRLRPRFMTSSLESVRDPAVLDNAMQIGSSRNGQSVQSPARAPPPDVSGSWSPSVASSATMIEVPLGHGSEGAPAQALVVEHHHLNRRIHSRFSVGVAA